MIMKPSVHENPTICMNIRKSIIKPRCSTIPTRIKISVVRVLAYIDGVVALAHLVAAAAELEKRDEGER